MRGSLVAGALFEFHCLANNMAKSGKTVYLSSSSSTCFSGLSTLPSNFDRVIALFAARKLVVGNWINDKDEYLRPNGVGA